MLELERKWNSLEGPEKDKFERLYAMPGKFGHECLTCGTVLVKDGWMQVTLDEELPACCSKERDEYYNDDEDDDFLDEC